MSKSIGEQTSWIAGISFSDKEGAPNSYAYGRAIDHRSDPKGITLNPRAELDSGSVVTDLPMWGARACTRTFSYGNTGNIYQKTSGAWSKVHTAANSRGNGLAYFTADAALYYAQDTTFGRLLDACTGSTFYDDFLGSEGGAPTNTKSIDLERSSSMYASRADTASTSITADLTIEAYLKFESLPATDEIYTIVSKWDENTNLRSYKMDFTTTSDFFGDGRDGALTISTNTTEDPLDANCSGTLGEYTLTLTNAHASFTAVAGDKVYIHQTRGTGAGSQQVATVASYSAGTLTLAEPLTFSPAHSATTTVANKAQVRILKQHTTVTVSSGITYTCKAWDGLKGGIIGWFASGAVSIVGTVTASGKGFRGGDGVVTTNHTGTVYAYQGESTLGLGTRSYLANGGGGGGFGSNSDGSSYTTTGAGAGAGYGGTGTKGTRASHAQPSVEPLGGNTYGDANLALINLGSGGGGGVRNTAGSVNVGGRGGGIIAIFGATPTITGSVVSKGLINNPSYQSGTGMYEAAGSGSGGSILFKVDTAVLGTALVNAEGGDSATGLSSAWGIGGEGGDGRIAVYYLTSVSGTTTPTAVTIQDSSLNTTDGYLLRLGISSNGTLEEYYTWNVTDILDTSDWARWAVSWENTTSTANFYRNGVLLGTRTGTATSISDNASVFAIGADFNSTAQNFYDGLMDDVRVWNDVRTASELMNNNDQVLTGEEANLIAYYQFESDVTDSQTAGNNDLTAANSPTYSNDVPFSGLTTRNDQDQGLTSGSFVQGYTLPTAINEGATHRQTFVPEKDPQKSIIIDIDTVGTGDWTLTVHDSLNREVASKTITNGELYTGFYEFTFSSVWRPIIGASYHFHLTSTVNDGVVDTVTTVDLETAYFTTHYQFLISDEYHPIKEFLDFMVVGNERYLAKFEAGDVYNPHRLTFPSGYRVRCLAYWREFLVIGCWKGTAITDFDDGRLFFWDGVSDTYNHSIPVPEGGVNAMFGTQDVLFLVAGYTGEILVYTGGGSATKFNKIPKLETGEYVEIAPGSMDMWRSNIHMGVNLNTDSATVHKGVYSIGSSNSAYTASLGFDYPTSLGDQTASTVKTSMVFPSGQNLYVGWQNGNAYGIDSINPTNDVYASGTVELLIADMGQISKEKYPLIIRADFEPLASGESIRVKYKADREDDWKFEIVDGTEIYEDTATATEYKLRIPERVKELQVACDLRTTVATSPKLLGISVVSEVEESSAQNE